jgi:hypothetical protein
MSLKGTGNEDMDSSYIAYDMAYCQAHMNTVTKFQTL